jgi:hypothetical protein
MLLAKSLVMELLFVDCVQLHESDQKHVAFGECWNIPIFSWIMESGSGMNFFN